MISRTLAQASKKRCPIHALLKMTYIDVVELGGAHVGKLYSGVYAKVFNSLRGSF